MSQDQERQIGKNDFRDHLSTVSSTGARNWIHAKKPKGRFYNARSVVAVFLLIFFFSGPFITIKGNPLLLINILEAKFVIFGLVFWPQDLYLLVFGTLTFIVFIVLFTSIFGRLFCGWACPQTIFLEMVFRRIEYWIEGDSAAQIRLKRAPWNSEKILKKGSKHIIFYALAFIISNLFLAYIIGKDQLFEIITSPPTEHAGGLASMIIFSGVFYGVFAFMREQVCHFVCPYGRMQSVMLDNNSINVMYDYKRGEDRAKIADRNKVIAGKATLADLGFSTESGFGDCIECVQCVKVCPMGIDIRNGTQLECIHCTACMDACDDVMDKIDKPRGLIRYASENSIRNETKKILTPRVAGYVGIFVILLSIFIGLMSIRTDIETIILRQPGTLYQTLPNDVYSNIYEIKVINKTFDKKDFELRLLEPAGEVVPLGNISSLEPQNLNEARFLVKLNKDQLTGLQTTLKFGVFSDGEQIKILTSGFIGPAK